MSNKFFFVFSTFFLAGSICSAKSSFQEVEQKIYAKPLETLPNHPGLGVWDVVKNLVGSESKPLHGLAVRSRRTLVDESDERPPEPKWLHPRGACASGEWSIDTETMATGLFGIGTKVPAIVRISSGDGTSATSNSTDFDGRILGMAVKLYPTTSKTQKMKTRNIVTLDRYGFERSKRKATFWENDFSPVYFTNVAPATSPLGKFLSAFFDRFDNPNWARPLYGVARAFGNDDLLEYRTPYEIRFAINQKSIVNTKNTASDFRDELKSLSGVSLDIILQSFDGKEVIGKKIGNLNLNKFVVSDYCDLNLHFHHNSIENQWEKYDDYGVVEDLAP